MEFSRYWVVPKRLMAGAYPGSPDSTDSEAKLSRLVTEGIRTFVDLTEPAEVTRLGPLRDYEGDLARVEAETSTKLAYARFPIRDLGVPPHGLMVAILDAVDAALSLSTPVALSD